MRHYKNELSKNPHVKISADLEFPKQYIKEADNRIGHSGARAGKKAEGYRKHAVKSSFLL